MSTPAESLPRARIHGVDLHYSVRGEGAPVVLVHGGHGDYRDWTSLADRLPSSYRLVAYSRRGYPPNRPEDAVGNSIVQHSRDLAAFLRFVSEEPIHVIADSLGALVALHCAAVDPRSMRSLAIDEPPLPSLLLAHEEDAPLAIEFESKVLVPAVETFRQGDAEAADRRIFKFLEGSEEGFDALPSALRAAILTNAHPTYMDLSAGFPILTEHDLRQIRTPTLLLKSERGPPFLRRGIDILSGLLPRSEVATVPGVAHGGIIFSPDYAATVSGFLERVTRT